MLNQKDLNFVPGNEYMYCNTGFILMAEIIQRISGEKFRKWMKKEIFEPLGMYNTYVEDRYNRIVPNNATSYGGSKQRGFAREVEFWGYTGSGNIHSTTGDLLKWYRNYHLPPSGWKDAFSMMLTVDKLNNGDSLNYAFGVRVESFRDEKRISHGGSIGGFRAFACTYPDIKLEIVALTNFSSSSAGAKVNTITNIILGKPAEEIEKFEMTAVEIDNSVFDKYVGTYTIDKVDDRRIDIFREKETFYYKGTGQGKVRLMAADNSTFFNNRGQTKIVFNETDKMNYTMTQRGRKNTGSKTEKYLPTEKELNKIAGKYWSPELQTLYTISVKDGKLSGYHTRHGEFKIECVSKDIYVCSTSFIRKISINRGKQGRITGIYVTNGRVRNLWLEKTE